jgi:hypothetical protein
MRHLAVWLAPFGIPVHPVQQLVFMPLCGHLTDGIEERLMSEFITSGRKTRDLGSTAIGPPKSLSAQA